MSFIIGKYHRGKRVEGVDAIPSFFRLRERRRLSDGRPREQQFFRANFTISLRSIWVGVAMSWSGWRTFIRTAKNLASWYPLTSR